MVAQRPGVGGAPAVRAVEGAVAGQCVQLGGSRYWLEGVGPRSRQPAINSGAGV